MQNIASVAKLAIQIISVLLLATIMGNKNRNNNNNNNSNNSNNNNNVFVLVMALPITTDDDISYKDNTDILILSDTSSSSINLNDGSYGIENIDTSGSDSGDTDGTSIINRSNSGNSNSNSDISNSNSNNNKDVRSNFKGNNNNNNNNNNNIKSASDDFIHESTITTTTTIGYNIMDNIENFSTIESNKDSNNNDDLTDEQNIIFNKDGSSLDTSSVNRKNFEISKKISSEGIKNGKTSTTIPNITKLTAIDNTGIYKEPSIILDRINSTKTQNSLLSSSSSLSTTSLTQLSTTSISSSSSASASSNNDDIKFSSSSSSQLPSSSSSSNLLLLSKNSYVPAAIQEQQQQQQQNLPIEDNLIALVNNGESNDTTVKTYLGMQSNITSSLSSSTSTSIKGKLLSSSLTSSSALTSASENIKLDNNPSVDDNIIAGSNTASGSISRTSSNNGGSITRGSLTGHSGVISSFSEAISSKLTLPKPQKTDAPMLNYIFDTYSAANKHHHHDQRYGPHFEDKREGNTTNITVQAGSTIHLNCRISLLQDKTVSWVKRNHNGDEEALELLTVGVHTYTGDTRFTIDFQYPSNWRLKISNVRKSDEGQYECQISTHPPRVIQINLHVNAPKVMIVDEYGIPLQEKYYEIDSTLQLSCIVRNVVMSTSAVYWSHGDQILNYDLTRGGVSVKTELMDDGANSTLFIAKINKSDSGNYTCSINPFHDYSIMVHILNGESFAELHHGNSSRLTSTVGILLYIVLIIFILQFHQRNKIYLILR